MILPSKHTSFSESLLGFSGYLLSMIKRQPQSVEDLWYKIENGDSKINQLYKKQSFDNLILSIDLLYMIGAIKQTEKGILAVA